MLYTDVQKAQDKLRAYRAEAERMGQVRRQGAKTSWRSQTAQALRKLAERLEPSPSPQPSSL